MPSPSRVEECIKKWRSLDFTSTTDDELDSHTKAFMTDLGEYVTAKWEREGEPVELYRVRPLDETWPWRARSEFLCPSPSLMRRSRCNAPGTSVLYCARLASTAVRETQQLPGQSFALFCYRVASPLALARVLGPTSVPNVLAGDQLASYHILRTFVQEEFTRHDEGEGAQYRISASLCRVWFGSSTHHGWLYPSVEASGQECIALKHEAVSKVEVCRAFALELLPHDGSGTFAARVLSEAVLGSNSCPIVWNSPKERQVCKLR